MKDIQAEHAHRVRHHKDTVVEEYLSLLVSTEQEPDNNSTDVLYARNIADQLMTTHKPLEKTVVIIPVAAASEQHTIGHALDEYARQTPERPFTVILGLNIDNAMLVAEPERNDDIEATLQSLAAARMRHPDLDVRSSFTVYEEPNIGEIRRDLWNGVLMAYQDFGVSPTEEIVGINHDIDVEHIPRHYIGIVQEHFDSPEKATKPAYGRTRHGWDSAHPNTSKAVMWSDYVNGASDVGFEAGAVIPMTYYAHHGGFNANLKISEVSSFTHGYTWPELINTGRLVTSPRRYVARLPDEGVDNIWTEDSFGTDDLCRDPSYLANVPDLPDDKLMDILVASSRECMPTILETTAKRLMRKIDSEDLIIDGQTPLSIKPRIREIVTDSFEARLRISRAVLSACLPDQRTIPAGEIQLEQYKFDLEVAVTSIYRKFAPPRTTGARGKHHPRNQ